MRRALLFGVTYYQGRRLTRIEATLAAATTPSFFAQPSTTVSSSFVSLRRPAKFRRQDVTVSSYNVGPLRQQDRHGELLWLATADDVAGPMTQGTQLDTSMNWSSEGYHIISLGRNSALSSDEQDRNAQSKDVRGHTFNRWNICSPQFTTLRREGWLLRRSGYAPGWDQHPGHHHYRRGLQRKTRCEKARGGGVDGRFWFRTGSSKTRRGAKPGYVD